MATLPGAVEEPFCRDAQCLEWLVQERSRRQVRDLHVVISSAGLILRGRAPCYYVKQLAQQAVLEIKDVVLLANEIVVY